MVVNQVDTSVDPVQARPIGEVDRGRGLSRGSEDLNEFGALDTSPTGVLLDVNQGGAQHSQNSHRRGQRQPDAWRSLEARARARAVRTAAKMTP